MAKLVTRPMANARPKPRPKSLDKKGKPMSQTKTVSVYRFKKGGSHIGP